MVRTPLLLSLFTFVYEDITEDETKTPEVKDVVNGYVKKRYMFEKQKFGATLPYALDIMEQILQSIAAYAIIDLQNINPVFSFDDVARATTSLERFTGKEIDKDTFLEQVTRLHILLSITTMDGISWQFWHNLVHKNYARQSNVYDLSTRRFSLTQDVKQRAREGDNTARMIVVYALNDLNISTRRGASDLLAEIADPQSVPALIDALKDRDEEVRVSVAEALSNIGGREVIIPLIEALKDSDPDVRLAAADGLRKSGDRRAIEPLQRLFSDHREGDYSTFRSTTVADMARKAIATIKERE